MTKPTISSKSRYTQGIYSLKNPQKYIGGQPIKFRSSWEKRSMKFFDEHPSVVFWNSEDLVVKYISPLDGKFHKYYVDFVVKMKTRSGEEVVYAIEVKPHKETLPPKTRSKKRLILETETYIVNQAKWKAATEFCQSNNMKFIVLTEYDLGIK